MNRHGLARASLIFAATLSACSDGAGPEQADLAYFRFSAQDAQAIVEISASDLARVPEWNVERDHAVRLRAMNEAEDELQLEEVTHVLRLPDGRLVAAAGRGARTVMMSTNGTPLMTLGRKGAGPGEFQYPSWLGLCGQNRLWIFDRMSSKLAIYDLQGSHLDELLVLPGQAPAMGDPACNSRGEFVIAGERELPENLEFGPFRPFLTLSARQVADESFRAVARVPGHDSYRWERQLGPLGDFAREPRYAMTSASVFVTAGDAFEIAEFATDGSLLTLIRANDVERSPVTKDDLRRVRNEQLTAAGEQYRARLARTLDSMTWPAFHPVLEDLLTDSSGCLWVRHYQPAPSHALWRVLSRSGQPLGVVHLPREFVLTQATNKDLVGFSRAQLEGHDIVSYPYTRPAALSC